jgi:hypothetical protein
MRSETSLAAREARQCLAEARAARVQLKPRSRPSECHRFGARHEPHRAHSLETTAVSTLAITTRPEGLVFGSVICGATGAGVTNGATPVITEMEVEYGLAQSQSGAAPAGSHEDASEYDLRLAGRRTGRGSRPRKSPSRRSRGLSTISPKGVAMPSSAPLRGRG